LALLDVAMMDRRVVYEFQEGLLPGMLRNRYKRFLATVEFEDGMKTVHCPNTGSMIGIVKYRDNRDGIEYDENKECLCSCSNDDKRKYSHTLEYVRDDFNILVGIYSSRANTYVRNALELGLIDEIKGFDSLQQEKNMFDSKIDFVAVWSKGQKEPITMLIEVKSVTLAVKNGSQTVAVWPDCVSERGQRHIKLLTSYNNNENQKSAIIFVIQRNDEPECFSASTLDRDYLQLLSQAYNQNVLVLPYLFHYNTNESNIKLTRRVPFVDAYSSGGKRSKYFK
jgi:sugar fermentation stimulation protein A